MHPGRKLHPISRKLFPHNSAQILPSEYTPSMIKDSSKQSQRNCSSNPTTPNEIETKWLKLIPEQHKPAHISASYTTQFMNKALSEPPQRHDSSNTNTSNGCNTRFLELTPPPNPETRTLAKSATYRKPYVEDEQCGNDGSSTGY
ncbi:hypothetical protein LTR10_018087 [Elasticomyces elasticus]|uniref:Uncharacterized protein n=1 Tax=Exophiala sideris TaxID=1016849 RepID=A0ABR0IWT5_9EURO|nr:hypothetical protein LTR10_018087 [Elasticomyces elasticus]KAK5021684.1 hypothetical protein LTS07_010726 [Exophiala sideris]KAK5025161.1 hypothetical protein LTR13_010598 [Exophiala sideris]KAK5050115.1 hypothetical protein LTR69_010749 [Exophiala sideris]KAK5176863.1 hypothetical protein LTR44_010559 [Eurotiomycetes sp. CCFEE 6388]